MHGTVGEFPDEPAVDRAGGELVVANARRGDAVLKHPLEFRRGKIRIGDESRRGVDRLGARRERETPRGGAPVLPDDRAADGHTGGAVPEYDGLALVGDAERRRNQPTLCDRFARRVECAGKDFVGVVLDLAGLRKVLRDLAVAAAGYAAVGRDDHAGRAGGAFVDCKNGFHNP